MGSSASRDSPRSTTPTSATKRPKTSRNSQGRKYRGTIRLTSGKWGAVIQHPDTRKTVWLGTFDTEEDAAIAFDVAALRFRGSSTELNFPERTKNHPSQNGNEQRRKYKGTRQLASGRWGAFIRNKDKVITKTVWLGTFDTEEDAAIGFDVAALRFRGSSAELNFPEGAKNFLHSQRRQGFTQKYGSHFPGNKTSGNYRGIRHTLSGKWSAQVYDSNNHKSVGLGTFPTAEDAALAYDEAALKFQGRRAKLNFPDRGPTRIKTLASEKQLKATRIKAQTLQACSRQSKTTRSGGSTKHLYVDKVMAFESDARKDVEIPTQELVIKAAQSDEASKLTVEESTEIVGNDDPSFPFEKKKNVLWSALECMEIFRKLPQKPHFRPLEQFNVSFREGHAIGCMVNFCSVVERSSRLQFLNEPKSSTNELLENLFKLEENGFNVEVVRERIAQREKLEMLRQQFEEAKGEIDKRIIEKAKIEEGMNALSEKGFEAMKEAKDHQIASLKLKRIVLEEDIADVECDFQASVASLGITGNNGVEESQKPGYLGSDGQLPMKIPEEVKKSNRGRPQKVNGFILPCNVSRKRKKRTVLECEAEYSLLRSHKRTKKEKDVQEEMIGSRVKVWWPDDKQYYEGIIESYDPAEKKHKVAYFDGDVEYLILKKERWLQVEETSDHQQDQVVPSASAMPVAESEVASESTGIKNTKKWSKK